MKNPRDLNDAIDIGDCLGYALTFESNTVNDASRYGVLRVSAQLPSPLQINRTRHKGGVSDSRGILGYTHGHAHTRVSV